MLLDIVSTCNNYELVNILIIFKKVMSMIQMFVPIILIVWGTIGFINLVMNPDEKKGVQSVINKFLAAMIVFLIPLIVNVVMGLLGENTSISSCWINADDSMTQVDLSSSSGSSSGVSVPGRGKPRTGSGSSSSGSSSSGSSGSSSSSSGSGGTISTTPVVPKETKTIFIGDSRTGHLYASLSGHWTTSYYSTGGEKFYDDSIFVAEGNMGLAWMKEIGIPAASKYFKSGNKIVILMGVNDYESGTKRYLDFFNSQTVKSWVDNGCSVYYVSVGPCSGKFAYRNDGIASFNSTMKNGLPSYVKYIDLHSYLSSSGFNSNDGLHYTGDSSIKIYNYIKNQL